jgi:poly(A) polymerase/tRNA nucleotidyltransferase (CCA-adding enzyme)
MLRAVRFAAMLGFRLEARTLEAIERMAPQIMNASMERIRDELIKILGTRKPSAGLRLMHRGGLLRQVLPELLEGHLKRQNEYHRFTILRHTLATVDAVEPELLLRVSALFHDVAKPRVRAKKDGRWIFHGHEEASASLTEEIMARLRFDNALISGAAHLIRHHLIGYRQGWSDGAVRRLIRRVGRDAIFDLLRLRKADILAHGRPDIKGHLLDELEERVRGLMREDLALGPGDLAIDGRKVMELTGLEQGPDIGIILRDLLDRVAEDPSLNTEEGLSRIVRALIPQ